MNRQRPLTLWVLAAAIAVLLALALRFWSGTAQLLLWQDEGARATALTAQNHSQDHALTPPGSGEAHGRAPVSLPASQLAGLDIRVEPARRESIARIIRTVATVVPDEARLSHVHTRVSGWIERLHVNTTGRAVRTGEPLAEIFSQELLASQNEYLAALDALSEGGSEALVRGARSRLRVLGMVDAEIDAIVQRGEAQSLVTVVAPRSGVVLRRAISVGTAVDPSTELLTIADLSYVWLLAEVPERDAHDVTQGTAATLEVPASGLEPFESTITFVYPTLTERTRTMRVRFVVPNPDQRLRPGMYGTATIRMRPREVLTVPRDAIVDTGIKQHVFVSPDEGVFVPQEVSVGVAIDDRLEISAGLRETDRVVSAGVFLIDSESRLRASSSGIEHGAH